MVARKNSVHVASVAMHLLGKPCNTPSFTLQNLFDVIPQMNLLLDSICSIFSFFRSMHGLMCKTVKCDCSLLIYTDYFISFF